MKSISSHEPAFRLPSPCLPSGGPPVIDKNHLCSGPASGKTVHMRASEMLSRRPDLESVLIDALELSMDELLGQ